MLAGAGAPGASAAAPAAGKVPLSLCAAGGGWMSVLQPQLLLCHDLKMIQTKLTELQKHLLHHCCTLVLVWFLMAY